MNKRILGFLSWRLNRRHIHIPEVLDKLIQDLDTQQANHLVISGDLTHIGTQQECRQVADWLAGLGSPRQVSVIPGNHDSYVRDDYADTLGLWSSYMSGDNASTSSLDNLFPSYRKRGALAIIGLSTAVPTAPFFATGKLGMAQINHMKECLEDARREGLFRVIVLHHGPLIDSNKFRKRLIDAPQFRQAINSTGAELILHGHGHYPVTDWLDTEKFRIPVIGAASASLLSSSSTKRAGYNIYDIKSIDQSWALKVQSRRLDENSGKFMDSGQAEIILPSG